MTKHANRGQFLEDWIEQANSVYNNKGQAIITKIPTPWKVQRAYSPYSKQYQIANAFPAQKSTVDFGGTADSRSIWFDVKTTKNKTNFPLVNIHKHQIEYLTQVHEQGGKAFILVHSAEREKVWLLWIKQLLIFLAENTRKSIPFDWFQENCQEIKKGNGVILDYLPYVLGRSEDEG